MINKEIEDYYNSGVEKERLKTDVSQLEEARTREIFLRYMEKAPLKIADVGGASGIYSFWLKSLGHQVHLIDPVETNLKNAHNYAIQNNITLDSISHGDAEKLPCQDDEMDVVLLMGPLYHLQKKTERMQALAEAKRVLKKGGIIFCAAISRYASMMDGFTRNLVADKNFISIMQQDLANGNHVNPTGKFDYFTTSYFHHPHELKSEIEEAGLQFQKTLPVESFGWLVPGFSNKWKDTEFKELLLQTIKQVENDETLIGISAHLLGIAIKL
ncbi:MAG TPA: class I SAM-dependent methyltransferase [Bacteroidia bacterium]|nr:class I SAM-dependent methyltransferase [Bacteroidia bacterium]